MHDPCSLQDRERLKIKIETEIPKPNDLLRHNPEVNRGGVGLPIEKGKGKRTGTGAWEGNEIAGRADSQDEGGA